MREAARIRKKQRRSMKRILFRGNNWLGDAIMSLPTIRAFRDLYPNVKIAVLTNSNLYELYKATPYVDEIISYDRTIANGVGQRTRNWLRLVKTIKGGRFDTAIIFPRSFSSAFTIFSARIPRRIGYKADGRGKLLTDAVQRRKELLNTHRIHYFANLISPITNINKIPSPSIEVNSDMGKWADGKLLSLNISRRDRIVGLNPSATYGSAKQWYPERFAETAKRLVEKYNAKILIFGGSSDTKLGETITSLVGKNVYNFSGQTTILQLAAFINRCSVFITNDTGPMHLADALGIPIVAIFGSTDPITTAPFGRNNTIIRHKVECAPCLLRTCPIDHRCMNLITVDEVYNAAMYWLER